MGPFKKQIYRGIEIDKLLEMDHKEVIAMFKSGQRRRVKHGMHPKYDRLVKKIKTSVKNAPHGEKPRPSRLISVTLLSCPRWLEVSPRFTPVSTGTPSRSRLICAASTWL